MICLVCGNTIEEGAAFCPCCGARVEDVCEDSMYLTFSEISKLENSYHQIITVVVREKTGDMVEITDYPVVLGRSSHCEVVIAGNPTIGRRHLLINRVGDRIYLEDMGSLNHTFLNGEQITSPVELVDCESIKLSNELFHLRKRFPEHDGG